MYLRLCLIVSRMKMSTHFSSQIFPLTMGIMHDPKHLMPRNFLKGRRQGTQAVKVDQKLRMERPTNVHPQTQRWQIIVMVDPNGSNRPRRPHGMCLTLIKRTTSPVLSGELEPVLGTRSHHQMMLSLFWQDWLKHLYLGHQLHNLNQNKRRILILYHDLNSCSIVDSCYL